MTRTARPAGLAALHARRRELAARSPRSCSPRPAPCCGSGTCAASRLRLPPRPGKRHGPYWRHTRKISNKTVGRRLTQAQAAVYTELTDNGRELRDVLTQMQELSDQARDLLLDALPDERKPAAKSPG